MGNAIPRFMLELGGQTVIGIEAEFETFRGNAGCTTSHNVYYVKSDISPPANQNLFLSESARPFFASLNFSNFTT